MISVVQTALFNRLPAANIAIQSPLEPHRPTLKAPHCSRTNAIGASGCGSALMLADGVEVDLHGEGFPRAGEFHESQGRQPRQLALEGAGRHIDVGGLNVGRDAQVG